MGEDAGRGRASIAGLALRRREERWCFQGARSGPRRRRNPARLARLRQGRVAVRGHLSDFAFDRLAARRGRRHAEERGSNFPLLRRRCGFRRTGRRTTSSSIRASFPTPPPRSSALFSCRGRAEPKHPRRPKPLLRDCDEWIWRARRGPTLFFRLTAGPRSASGLAQAKKAVDQATREDGGGEIPLLDRS